jgi:transcriptional regulator with XRE-family HTH domain
MNFHSRDIASEIATNQLGEKLRKFRETLGKSRNAFALEMRMDSGYYSKIEQGKIVPTFYKVDQICKYWKIEPNWLHNYSVKKGGGNAGKVKGEPRKVRRIVK